MCSFVSRWLPSMPVRISMKELSTLCLQPFDSRIPHCQDGFVAAAVVELFDRLVGAVVGHGLEKFAVQRRLVIFKDRHLLDSPDAAPAYGAVRSHHAVRTLQ